MKTDGERFPSFYCIHRNQPFAPADLRSAAELTCFVDQPYRSVDGDVVEPGMNSIRRTLVNGWKTVDELTRVNEK